MVIRVGKELFVMVVRVSVKTIAHNEGPVERLLVLPLVRTVCRVCAAATPVRLVLEHLLHMNMSYCLVYSPRR